MKYLYKLIKVAYSTLTLLSIFLKYTFKWHLSIFRQTLLQFRARFLKFEIKLLILFFSNALKNPVD